MCNWVSLLPSIVKCFQLCKVAFKNFFFFERHPHTLTMSFLPLKQQCAYDYLYQQYLSGFKQAIGDLVIYTKFRFP